MKAGRLFPIASPYSVLGHRLAVDHRIISTGEYRPPKKGEWYISGAIAEGYETPNDLPDTMKFWIGKLVKVKVETITTVIEEY
jgi:hypothetical protein